MEHIKRHYTTLAATAVVALLLLLTLGASRASATTVTYEFTSDHCSDGCGTPPFGEVVVTGVGTNVTVAVTLFDGSKFVATGAGDKYYLKFNVSGVALADIINITPTSVQAYGPGSFDGDGTGLFNFGITCPACLGTGGGNHQDGSTINFEILNASLSDFFANPQGNVFVADIISGQTGFTGPVDAKTPVVPDGGMTLMLLGGVLVGLETLRRKFRV